MISQDKVVTRAMKELGWVLQLTKPQNEYLRTFLNCIYDLGSKDGNSKREKPVVHLENDNIIQVYPSEKIAAQKTGYTQSSISRLIKTGKASRLGYKFKFL